MMEKHTLLARMILTGLTACNERKEAKMGSYAYGVQFLKGRGIKYAELKSKGGGAKVMAVLSWQGRVATMSAVGDEGNSYGWINYRFIEAGK